MTRFASLYGPQTFFVPSTTPQQRVWFPRPHRPAFALVSAQTRLWDQSSASQMKTRSRLIAANPMNASNMTGSLCVHSAGPRLMHYECVRPGGFLAYWLEKEQRRPRFRNLVAN
jgi:hypothetical protein